MVVTLWILWTITADFRQSFAAQRALRAAKDPRRVQTLDEERRLARERQLQALQEEAARKKVEQAAKAADGAAEAKRLETAKKSGSAPGGGGPLSGFAASPAYRPSGARMRPPARCGKGGG